MPERMLKTILLASLLTVGGCGFAGLAKTASGLDRTQCPTLREVSLTVLEPGASITATDQPLYVMSEEDFKRWELYVIGLEEASGCNP